MDYSKIRCTVCFKHFCCAAHRADHEVKSHSEIITKQSQDYLVSVFQKKVETLLLKSQKRQAIVKTVNEKEKATVKIFNEKEQTMKCSQSIKNKPVIKRLHNEMDKRILTSSVTIMSQTRQILVPVYRLKKYNFSNNEVELKLKDANNVRKDSPCDMGIVKTSTPIVDNIPTVEEKPQNGWNISLASTISNYQTPSGASIDDKPEHSVLRTQPNKEMGLSITTPLRSIISKTSKSKCDNETGPNLNTSRCRRVTFSFSSQVSSSNNSPLESVQEVDIHEEIRNETDCIVEPNAQVKNYVVAGEDVKQMKALLEDSSPSIKSNGFFSCMTSMFRSAVHTIPAFVSWRMSQNDHRNRMKRSRSPDTKETDLAEIHSNKRPCYPRDLRLNPIKSRKPIAKY